MTPTSRGIQIVHDRDRAFDAGMVRGRMTQRESLALFSPT